MRILNLGAGVQSTTIFLMAGQGLVPPIDYSIFADTQEEPQAVYEHLEWLKSLDGYSPIITATAGKLGDHLLAFENPSRQKRFASIPAFTAPNHEERTEQFWNGGMVRRQCTKEYKIEVVGRCIRREILGLKPRQRMPKTIKITQIFGISLDERQRAKNIEIRFDTIPWANPQFPLIAMGMTRDDCREWLNHRVPHEVPRSACVFCPYKKYSEWLKTKQKPNEWERAVQIDRGLRDPTKVVNRKLDQSLYLSRKCIPLEMVDIEGEAVKESERERVRGEFPLVDLLECDDGMCGR